MGSASPCCPPAAARSEARVDLKLIGFSEKELAEYLGEYDTDLEDEVPRPEEAGQTIRCPKCGHEFAKR